MSVYYNQNITKERKRQKITMTSLQLSEKAPPNWGLHLEFATMVDRRGTFTGNAKRGDSPGDSPTPLWDPAFSARVTTGGLSAPVSRWKVRCLLLRIYVSQTPVHAPLLGIHVEEPQGSHNGREAKVIFLLDSGACFSVLPLSPSPQSNDEVIIWGISGKPLERYFTRPLACSWETSFSFTLSS
jgi:hypothetical protein